MNRVAGLLLLVLCMRATAEVQEYADVPLPVLLPLGQERQISVEGAQKIRVGVPAHLQAHLDVESAGSNVWLRAHQPLESERLYLETETDLYVLEVQTSTSAPAHPLQIRLRSTESSVSKAPAPDYVALARYAVQTLYAPDEREVQVPGIRRIALPNKPRALFRCRPVVPAACGSAVEIAPHTAWRAPPFYATALTVRNLLPESLELDPRDIRGDFSAAVIVHPQLAAAGSLRDTTTMVLISTVPFARALP